MHVCLCMCMYVCTYVCVHVCMYARLCVHVCMHARLCACMHVCMHVAVCVHMYMYVCIYIMHMHVYVCTHLWVYVHACVCVFVLLMISNQYCMVMIFRYIFKKDGVHGGRASLIEAENNENSESYQTLGPPSNKKMLTFKNCKECFFIVLRFLATLALVPLVHM